MRLYIKNMVCNRCVAAVKTILDEIKLPYTRVNLGEVEIEKESNTKQLEALRERLLAAGFELLDDGKKKIIEKIKTIIIEQVHYPSGKERFNLSHNLTSNLHKDYSYLSHLFSDVEGITIEKYCILQKIEKAKEQLVYDETSLSQIAFDLGYSSVAHLSAQFKKITGLTPSHFKKFGGIHRKSIDKV